MAGSDRRARCSVLRTCRDSLTFRRNSQRPFYTAEMIGYRVGNCPRRRTSGAHSGRSLPAGPCYQNGMSSSNSLECSTVFQCPQIRHAPIAGSTANALQKSHGKFALPVAASECSSRSRYAAAKSALFALIERIVLSRSIAEKFVIQMLLRKEDREAQRFSDDCVRFSFCRRPSDSARRHCECLVMT